MQSKNPIFTRSEGFNGRGNAYGNHDLPRQRAGATPATAATRRSGAPVRPVRSTQVDQGRMSIDSVVQKTGTDARRRGPGRGRHLVPHR